MQLRDTLHLLYAIALPIAAGLPAAARADGSATGMALRGYVAATARIQDPAGSDWKTVATGGLPRGVPVERYQPGGWVDVHFQGHLIRIKLSSVYLDNVTLDGVTPIICSGRPGQAVPGSQGFGPECPQ